MSLGFSVRIIENNVEKKVRVKSECFSIGRAYKNSIVLPIEEKEIKLIELKDGAIILYHNNRIKTVIFSDNSKYDFEELLKLFPSSSVIKLKTNCKIYFQIESYEIWVELQEFGSESKRTVSQDFRKKIVTKENIKFASLTSIITIILFSVTGFAAYYFKQIKPTSVKKMESQEMVEREVGYALNEKLNRSKISKEERAPKSKGGEHVEQSTSTARESIKGAFIATAPAEAPKQGGVLAVQEGAKTVIIKREKSLFSKLDEALELPATKKEDKSINESDKKSFQSAKVEDIHTGPTKKEIKVELDETEKLKVQQKTADAKVVVGKRPEAEITNTLSKYKKGFEFIFVDERKRDPDLKGKVVVFFVVDNTGNVSKAEIMETDIKNKVFLDKIINLVKSIKFPHTDKGDTSIKLPLLFFPS